MRLIIAVALGCLSASAAGQTGSAVVCKGTACKTVSRGPAQLPLPRSSRAEASFAVACPAARIVDGDTLRCGRDRIRLLGIDAPEIERCPKWRVCAPGDGQASKRSLLSALRRGPVSYEPVTRDRYGRIVGVVRAGSVNLSCWQLEQGQAIYKRQWDNGGRIAGACG